jgi:hypothetical protein
VEEAEGSQSDDDGVSTGWFSTFVLFAVCRHVSGVHRHWGKSQWNGAMDTVGDGGGIFVGCNAGLPAVLEPDRIRSNPWILLEGKEFGEGTGFLK